MESGVFIRRSLHRYVPEQHARLTNLAEIARLR